ncbi:hypothetical protein Nepgr_028846 [Nepenthes gracilis]|uniref:Pentatricopeptide repeat-containing protein n=1 Tax=Nepenthes gracilis TaxID=150966 RepID=A0AAD3TBH2_NEPGR|nr:hypothetical protein Nepgr_028846 [Nepenthes gracilis]
MWKTHRRILLKSMLRGYKLVGENLLPINRHSAILIESLIMTELLNNSHSMIVASSGLTCQRFYFIPCDYSVNFSALGYQKHAKFPEISSRVILNEGVVVLGIKQSRLCRPSLLNRPQNTFHSFNLKVLDASIDYGPVHEEDGENILIEMGTEELPLPGSLRMHHDSKIEGRNVNIPLIDSKDHEIRLHYLEQRDEKALSNRILALSRTNKMRSALELFKSMLSSGLQPDSHACNSILSCLSRNNMLEHALEVFKLMKTNKITSGHSYSLALKAVAHGCGSAAALRMFWELEGEIELREDFDAIVYNTVLSVCAKENDWVQLERIWNAMKKTVLCGTTVTYRVLVCTFVRCGECELAIEAYNEMLQAGLRPTEDLMQAIIGACTKEGKWEIALNVFQNMMKCGLKPNLVACNSLIASLGKAGKVKDGFKIFNLMKALGHSPDAYTWNALIGALYRGNRLSDALQLFDSINKVQTVPLNVQLYNTALICCQKLGLWDKALQILWKMEDSGVVVSTTTYNLVIGACEAARKPQIALQVYEHMVSQKSTPDTFTYLSLIRSCTWGSLWAELEEILDSTAPNVSMYNAVIHGMCLRGKIESAKKTYRKMREIGLTPDGKTRALMLQHLKKPSTRSSYRIFGCELPQEEKWALSVSE